MSRIAIITGASSGIGAATADLFLSQGFRVINVSRRECPATGAENYCADLSTPANVEALAGRLLAEIEANSPEQICLVHNAALMLKDCASDCGDDDLAGVLQINVGAINSLNRALLPAMPRGSSIIIVGSTLSEKAVGGAFSYVVSKHAQLGLMRATCQDLMGSGVHTCMVGPGFTDTEMLRGHIGNDADVITAIESMNSFGRLIEPREIAELIVWAHANPVINGAVLHANLGQLER